MECVNISFSGAFEQSNSKRAGVVAIFDSGVLCMQIACLWN